MADPSQLSDEELQNVIDTGVEPEEPASPVEEPTTPEPPAEEPAPAEPEEEAPAPVAQEPAQEPTPEEKPPSRRENLRIQQLLQRYGPPPERPRPQQAPSQPNSQQLDYGQALDADPETIQALEADRQRFAQAQYIQGQSEGVKRAEFLNWNTSLKIDAPVVEKKYPVLDQNSPEFHPAVADAVNSWYLNMTGFDPQTGTVANPNVGYADFVEGFMELVQETAGQKVTETAKNIAKQTAATGLRPDGSSAKRLNLNRPASEMTMEELYASIGQTPPKKS